MENVIFDFKSRVGDGLKVYEDRVVISHSGVMNFFAMGIKGDKTIYYSDLTAVEFKKEAGRPAIFNFHCWEAESASEVYWRRQVTKTQFLSTPSRMNLQKK